VRISSLLAPEGSEYHLASTGSFLALPALSPDGKRLVFGARSPDGKASQLWVRELGSAKAQPLPGTDSGSLPFWSPDSRYVGFASKIDGVLKKIDVLGGPPATIAALNQEFRGGSWNSDGVIIFSENGPQSPVMKVPHTGGTASPATAVEKGKDAFGNRFPSFLPDGRHFLYIAPHSGGPNSVRVGSLDDAVNPGKVVAEAESNAIYSEGHLLYLRAGTLMAHRFDVDKLETTGEAVAIAERIPTSLQPGRVGHFTASASGLLVHAGSVTAEDSSRLAWLDRSGNPIGILEDVPARIIQIQLSPDRKSLLASLTERKNNDLWIYDVEHSRRARFTFDPGAEPYAVWTPDGKTIIWRNGPGALYRKAANFKGTDELLLAGPGLTPSSISPDGKVMLFVEGGLDIGALPLTPAQPGAPLQPRKIVNTRSGEDHAQFSPDGKWMAYTSDEAVIREAYVIPYPGPGGKQQISSGGATQVRWRSDGRELFYVTRDGDLMAAEISARGEMLTVGRIQKLFGGVIATGGYLYDVSLDGQRFIVAQSRGGTNDTAPPPLTFIENWTGLLSATR
jgi:Tol biopolymer transport system component